MFIDSHAHILKQNDFLTNLLTIHIWNINYAAERTAIREHFSLQGGPYPQDDFEVIFT